MKQKIITDDGGIIQLKTLKSRVIEFKLVEGDILVKRIQIYKETGNCYRPTNLAIKPCSIKNIDYQQ